MTELEKIQYAKSFVDQLANGINPLDGTPVPEGDIVNNVRLSRCFFYVSDILRQVIENGGVNYERQPRVKKQAFSLSPELRSGLIAAGMPMTVTDIAKYLNGLIDTETTKKLAASDINRWLMDAGLVQELTRTDGKKRKSPTDEGRAAGVFQEERTGQFGAYTVMLLNSQAQQLVYDNLEAVIELKYRE